METKDLKNRPGMHLLAGCAAAVLAFGPLRNSKWRYPLLSLAGLEILNGINKYNKKTKRASAFPGGAPELVQTDIVNGILMRWEDHGDKSTDSIPVILVHGLPTNPRVWRYVIPQIANTGVRCLAWEQVGFGWSMEEGFGMDISISRQAEYLYGWLQHLGISKAVFVGHDYGGGVIQKLVSDHPELASGLILTDSVAYDNWPVTAVRMAKNVSGAIENLPAALIKPILLAAVSNLGHSDDFIKEESFSLYWQPYNRSIGPKALAHQLRHFNPEETKEVSAVLENLNLSVPARVVWGEKDPLSMESAERLAMALKAPLIKIPGARHFTIEDHSEIIAQTIKDVIAEVMVPA